MTICFIGTTELILIGGLALLLVGGKKLPEMMRGLGKGVREFKDGMREGDHPEPHVEHDDTVTDDGDVTRENSSQTSEDKDGSR